MPYDNVGLEPNSGWSGVKSGVGGRLEMAMTIEQGSGDEADVLRLRVQIRTLSYV